MEGNEAVIRVRDEGIGIPDDDLPRIFDCFERVSTWSGEDGMGLGLWITRQIVEAHGGGVMAESKFGKGSTFTIRLPL